MTSDGKKDSPFKFLDAYDKEDERIFFGRNKEIKELYDALSGVKHLVVYGPTGVGKSSLIECGLRNQFSDADWMAVTIRKGNHISKSFALKMQEALAAKGEELDISLSETDTDFFKNSIERLYKNYFKPIYLLFDQFEEIFVEGTENERKIFFEQLRILINHRIPCKIILIMRDEFIGIFSKYEHLSPGIFQYRYRLGKMDKNHTVSVTNKTLSSYENRSFYDIENPKALSEKIVEIISKPNLNKKGFEKEEVELIHLQVFLNELWIKANNVKKENQKPKLDISLIDEEKDFKSILTEFLKRENETLGEEYGKNIPLLVLGLMVSEHKTKLQLSISDLQKGIAANDIELQSKLEDLIRNLQDKKLIRSLNIDRDTKYEISHDLLAEAVFEGNLSGELIFRKKALETYKVYSNRTGYLDKNGINHLKAFEKYAPFPKELNTVIKRSLTHLKKQKDEKRRKAEAQKKTDRRRKWVYVIMGTLLLFALSFALFNEFRSKELEAEREELNLVNTKLMDLQVQNVQLLASEKQNNIILAEKNDSLINIQSALEQNQNDLDSINNILKEQSIVLAAKNEELNGKVETISEQLFVIADLNYKSATKNIYDRQYKAALEDLENVRKYGVSKYRDSLLFLYMKVAFIYNNAGAFKESVKLLNRTADIKGLNLQSLKTQLKTIPKNPLEKRKYLNALIKKYCRNHTRFSFYKGFPKMVFVEGGPYTLGCDSLVSDCTFKVKRNNVRPVTSGPDFKTPDLEDVEFEEIGPDSIEIRFDNRGQYNLKSFYLSEAETTWFQYLVYCDLVGKVNPRIPSWGLYERHPVVNVSWIDAIRYCNWRSEQAGLTKAYILMGNNFMSMNKKSNGFMLPNEVEWEYAAKEGQSQLNYKYSGSDDLLKVAVFRNVFSGRGTKKIMTKKPNSLQLYDMTGNVQEWCHYSNEFNTFHVETKYTKPIRGGSWKYGVLENHILITKKNPRNSETNDTGFRILLPASQ